MQNVVSPVHAQGLLLVKLSTALLLGFAFSSTVLTWMLVSLSIRHAPRVGLIDRPNERSSHTRITPRGGGIGFIFTCLAGCLVWRVLDEGGYISSGPYAVLLMAVLVVVVVSLWDDFRSIDARVRLAFHLVCAAAVIAAFGWFQRIDIGWSFLLGRGGIFITLLWVVGLTNVFNFMDGIDGIAGLQGLG